MLDLIASETGVAASRIPLGADLTHWVSEPPRTRVPGARARIVSVASLTPVKDHATLLRAAALMVGHGRDVIVDLVGLDTSKGAVPGIVRELGIEDHVHLHGFLTQTEARSVVRQADVMVVASLHEAGPVAMLEAAAVGVPIVGTPVGHVPEWAPQAAVVVPFADPGALKDALAGLLDDERRRLSLASAAQQRALAEDADWTAARFLELYGALSAGRPARSRGSGEPLESPR
jgi:glycosyltransferase involved in cell wall biosynthesis